MRVEERMQLLYRWGSWVWYYRALALVIYATGALIALGFAGPMLDLVLNPSLANVVLAGLIVLLFGMWCLWAWVAWRDGQSRAASISFDPERSILHVRTLHFSKRRIPLDALGDIRYWATQRYTNSSNPYGNDQYYEPRLVVQVRDALPLRIDLQGQIVDEPAFKTIFRYDSAKPTLTNRHKRKGREVRS